MNRRWLWLVALAVIVVMLVCLRWHKGQSAPVAPAGAARSVPATGSGKAIDLTRHDGQTIDFSTGRPVVKDSPAEQAANAKAVRQMDAAAKDVTFAPIEPKTAAKTPAAPPKN